MGKDIDHKKLSAVSWITSILFHLILGLAFLAVTIDMSPIIPEFAELTIIQVAAVENNRITPDIPSEFTTPPAPAPAQGRNTRVVDIPTRRMTELEQETIPLTRQDKIQAEESKITGVEKIDPILGITREPGTSVAPAAITDRRQAGAGDIDIGRKTLTPISPERVVGDIPYSVPYEITWEGGVREILAEMLPSFPENIAKEVTLTFRIAVLPDGSVQEITTLKKGEATLESVTRQALKQWLFNPLEQSAPKETQFGTITIKFVLQ